MIAKPITLTTPLQDKALLNLKAGDVVSLNGVIYTGRDAAHKRFIETLSQGSDLPIDLNGQIIYYVGPAPAKPGFVIGPCGPTTSYRMDSYTPALLQRGLKAMIGKGPRSPQVIDAMKKYGAVYFAAIGGAAAVISKAVKNCEVVVYEDLGPEAVYRLTVENMICIVAIDSQGNDLYKTR